jgi:hypothetical protein
MIIELVGVTFEGPQDKISMKLDVDDIVQLLKEPNNAFDKNAIAVLNINSEKIGYIPKENNQEILLLMRDKPTLEAKVSSIKGFSEGMFYSISLFIDDRKLSFRSENYNGKIIEFKNLKYQLIDKVKESEELNLLPAHLRTVEDDKVSLLGANDTEIENLSVGGKVTTFWKKYSSLIPYYTVKAISKQAFKNNQSIQKIELLNDLMVIGIEAFANCVNLKQVNGSSTFWGDSVFEGCQNLEGVSIRGVSIGDNIFKNCKSLSKVQLDTQGFLSSIGKSAFENCLKLEKIDLSSSNLTKLEDRTFANCINLKQISLPSSINVIGKESFLGCHNLEALVVHSDLLKIEENAFKDCKSLKRVFFGGNVKKIMNFAFSGCELLEKIHFSNSIYEIEDRAFDNCKNLKVIEIDRNSDWIKQNFKRPTNISGIISSLDFRQKESERKRLYSEVFLGINFFDD